MKNFILACLMTLGLSVSYDVIANSKEPAVVYSAIPNNPTLLLFSLIGIYLFLTYVQKNQLRLIGYKRLYLYFLLIAHGA